MGTNNSKPLEELSSGEVSVYVLSSLGGDYQSYAKQILQHGIDGALLAELAMEGDLEEELMKEIQFSDEKHKEILLKEIQTYFIKTTNKNKKRDSGYSAYSGNTLLSSDSTHSLNSANYSVGSAASYHTWSHPMHKEHNDYPSSIDLTNTTTTTDHNSNQLLKDYRKMARSTSFQAEELQAKFRTLMRPKQRLENQRPNFQWNTSTNKSNTKNKGNRSNKIPTSSSSSSSSIQKKIAIVLTDIEGSTSLWEHNSQAMAKALNLHNTILRRVAEQYYGYTLGTEGDAYFFSFASPQDALGFAIQVQQELNQAGWKEDILAMKWAKPDPISPTSTPSSSNTITRKGLRVRVTVHYGPVESCRNPLTGRTQYKGAAMKFTKKLETLTLGGQILTTLDTWMEALASSNGSNDPTATLLREAKVAALGSKEHDTISKLTGGITKPILEIAPKGLSLFTTSNLSRNNTNQPQPQPQSRSQSQSQSTTTNKNILKSLGISALPSKSAC